MKNKRHAGVTLVEILLAVGILAIVAGPVLALFQASTRANAASRKITIASFTAQLYMEELVGLDEDELREKFERDDDESGDYTGSSITLKKDDYNGFHLEATVDFAYDFAGEFEMDITDPSNSPSFAALAYATVEISEIGSASVLSSYENVLRVAP